MTLNEYLPKPSEYSDKVARALNAVRDELYLVGSAARKELYKLNANPADYDFVLSRDAGDARDYDDVVESLTAEFGDKVKTGAWGSPNGIEVDCEVFALKVRVEPIDRFLRGVIFAGDGLAIHAGSYRVLTIPEYITMPPLTVVRPVKEDEAQAGAEWIKRHAAVLETFTDEMMALGAKLDEPSKA